ncbi:MAG: hypothetical protein IH939_20165 [Acidobacteria bacterium]|nr:hypothetical protein [Acidobacteriota bacterium]
MSLSPATSPHVAIGQSLRVALTLMVAPLASQAQEPSLADVLARATDYVNELHEQLSGMVAEERYEQRSSAPVTLGFDGDPVTRRVLRSDFLLIRPEGEDRYYGFRDVFEVDGRAVRDRQERLTRLFLDPSLMADRQIQGIRMDSARYNLGGVERSFNTPTYALLFLHSSYKLRFEFERVMDTSPPLGLDLPANIDGVWVLGYKETWPTTVIRGGDGRNLPAEGRFWIEPATGHVLVTELIVNDAAVNAIITVRYEADDTMGHLVPVEMRERYNNRRVGSRVDATATYSRFRRFQVQVEVSKPFRE